MALAAFARDRIAADEYDGLIIAATSESLASQLEHGFWTALSAFDRGAQPHPEAATRERIDVEYWTARHALTHLTPKLKAGGAVSILSAEPPSDSTECAAADGAQSPENLARNPAEERLSSLTKALREHSES